MIETETYEPPKELTRKNVIYWSEHYKKLEGTPTGKAIQTKAKKFLKEDCIQYDPDEDKYDSRHLDGHKFICKPIKGYNKTTYRMWRKTDGEFECSCQFYQKVGKIEGINCSHITALWLWIKIHNWNKSRH